MAKPRARVKSDRIQEISFSSQRIKADGRSSCEVRIKLATGFTEPFDLKLTAGSFAPDQIVREASLQPEDGEVPFQLDGDVAGTCSPDEPVRIEVVPAAVRLLVPPVS